MSHWEQSQPSRKAFRLKDAAASNMLVVVTCTICRRTTHFLAADLVQIYGGNIDAHHPPLSCARCKTEEWMRVKLRVPASGDFGHLEVRRPAGIRTTQMWKTVKLGD